MHLPGSVAVDPQTVWQMGQTQAPAVQFEPAVQRVPEESQS